MSNVGKIVLFDYYRFDGGVYAELDGGIWQLIGLTNINDYDLFGYDNHKKNLLATANLRLVYLLPDKEVKRNVIIPVLILEMYAYHIRAKELHGKQIHVKS